jgi:hypothetical protein
MRCSGSQKLSGRELGRRGVGVRSRMQEWTGPSGQARPVGAGRAQLRASLHGRAELLFDASSTAYERTSLMVRTNLPLEP